MRPPRCATAHRSAVDTARLDCWCVPCSSVPSTSPRPSAPMAPPLVPARPGAVMRAVGQIATWIATRSAGAGAPLVRGRRYALRCWNGRSLSSGSLPRNTVARGTRARSSATLEGGARSHPTGPPPNWSAHECSAHASIGPTTTRNASSRLLAGCDLHLLQAEPPNKAGLYFTLLYFGGPYVPKDINEATGRTFLNIECHEGVLMTPRPASEFRTPRRSRDLLGKQNSSAE